MGELTVLIGRKALGTVAYMGGVPAVLEKFCWAWGQMIQWNEESLATPSHCINYDRASISDHGPARNSLVSRFVGDWLIQLDTDHNFAPDLVEKLVITANEHNVDVLTACYVMKNPPHVPVIYQWVNIGESVGLQPIADWDSRFKLMQIGSAGAGALFVRRNVFNRIVTELNQQPFDKIYPYSEDHSFFYRCRKLDIKCYAHMRLESKHLRVSEVSLADVPRNTFSMSEYFPVENLDNTLKGKNNV